jgi:hypothetical protein
MFTIQWNNLSENIILNPYSAPNSQYQGVLLPITNFQMHTKNSLYTGVFWQVCTTDSEK